MYDSQNSLRGVGHVVPAGTLVFFQPNPSSWESHPDGQGGYRPTDPLRRGNIELPCALCGRPLVREGAEEIMYNSTVGCCGAGWVGAGIKHLQPAAR